MRKERLVHSLRLLWARSMRKRTVYMKEHDILGGIGDNCVWGPWLVPLYPELIKLHNNVRVHKTVKIVTHDVINGFLQKSKPKNLTRLYNFDVLVKHLLFSLTRLLDGGYIFLKRGAQLSWHLLVFIY